MPVTEDISDGRMNWHLVPWLPTEDMIACGAEWLKTAHMAESDEVALRNIWCAMIRAAPASGFKVTR